VDTNNNRVHYYYADASGLGGNIERPIKKPIPVQAPLSLLPVGGHASANAKGFDFEGIFSFKGAHTQVSGSRSEKSGGWTTLASASVEGLNVSDVVTADLVVAQISTDHPAVGYVPSISFVGTQFQNLKIAGRKVEVVLNLNKLSSGNGAHYPTEPHWRNQNLREAVGKQHERMINASQQSGDQDKSFSEWLKNRYQGNGSNDRLDEKGAVLCSLVDEVQGTSSGKTYGHVICVPDFGKIILGELILEQNSYHLTMIRLELGSPTQGCTTFAATTGGGSTHP
jgi:hypothetical protein